MEYWISLKGEKQGPLKEWDIRALIEEGKAEPTDLVWHSDLDEWEKLGDYTAFRSCFAQKEADEAQVLIDDEDRQIEEIKQQLQQKIEEVTGQKGVVPEVIKVEPPSQHYWVRRGFAKVLDLLVYWVLFFMFTNSVGVQVGIDPDLDWVRIVMLIPFFLIEAYLLMRFGVTPGKFILGLRVERYPGLPPLSFNSGFFRSMASWFFGMAMGFFPFFIISMIISYFSTKQRGMTSWDAIGKTVVRSVSPAGPLSVVSYICFVLGLLITNTLFVLNHERTRLDLGQRMVDTIPQMAEQIRTAYRLPEADAEEGEPSE